MVFLELAVSTFQTLLKDDDMSVLYDDSSALDTDTGDNNGGCKTTKRDILKAQCFSSGFCKEDEKRLKVSSERPLSLSKPGLKIGFKWFFSFPGDYILFLCASDVLRVQSLEELIGSVFSKNWSGCIIPCSLRGKCVITHSNRGCWCNYGME